MARQERLFREMGNVSELGERRDAIEGADGLKLTSDRFGHERRTTVLSARETFLFFLRETGGT